MSNYRKYHNFHIVDPSPWPFTTSIGSFGITFGSVLIFHFYEKGLQIFLLGLVIFLSSISCWWRDVIRESTFEGNHTKVVQAGLRIGMVLFIISEVMFFVSFFWSYLHSSLSPAIEIGCIWPPRGFEVLSAWGVPLLNTLVLLSSGVTLTWCHLSILGNAFRDGISSFLFTLMYASLFTALQYYEYMEAQFDISDGIYGSIFYMSTGFHGFHVIVGSIFILVCFIRYLNKHFTRKRHLGFECAAWYWHFVDVVWLILFFLIYYWGNEMHYKLDYFDESNNIMFSFNLNDLNHIILGLI
jgi:cytochrome c oxidase subunit 3